MSQMWRMDYVEKLCARVEGERNDRGARGRVKECDRCGRVLTVPT